MERFWDLLERSIIVQSFVTLMAVSTVCYLYIIGQPVPEGLMNVVLLIMGYWFGTKSQVEIRKLYQKQLEEKQEVINGQQSGVIEN